MRAHDTRAQHAAAPSGWLARGRARARDSIAAAAARRGTRQRRRVAAPTCAARLSHKPDDGEAASRLHLGRQVAQRHDGQRRLQLVLGRRVARRIRHRLRQASERVRGLRALRGGSGARRAAPAVRCVGGVRCAAGRVRRGGGARDGCGSGPRAPAARRGAGPRRRGAARDAGARALHGWPRPARTAALAALRARWCARGRRLALASSEGASAPRHQARVAG
jgi:hypothetical protein